MTDGTFLSRAWPSIVALVGTVIVVVVLLFLFGDDGSGGGDETTTGVDGTADGEQNADGDDTNSDPAAEQTAGDGTDAGAGETDDGGEQTEEPGEGPATPVEAPAGLRTPVGILNSTSVAGLAAGAQDRFIDGGWEVPVITDYSGEVEGTTAYYPTDDLRESAEALQAQFPEIRFVEPTPSGNLARDRILVILADDYAEAVGATESG